jgi:hypothetical protein
VWDLLGALHQNGFAKLLSCHVHQLLPGLVIPISFSTFAVRDRTPTEISEFFYNIYIYIYIYIYKHTHIKKQIGGWQIKELPPPPENVRIVEKIRIIS